MNETDILELGEPQRLHALTMVTRLGDVFKQAWGAAVAAVFIGYQGQWLAAAGLVGLVILINLMRPLVMWLSFTYMVGEDGIEMKSGVLSRNHRTIPFDRVQDVNLEQNILHRLFGMAKVKLETGGSAGGKGDDGVIDSIKLEDAERLRDTIRVHRAGAQSVTAIEATEAQEVEEAAPIFAMDHRRVLLAGVFNFSLAVLGVLFGAAQTVGDLAGINPFSGSFWRSFAAEGAPFMDFIVANQIITAIFGTLSLVVVGLATGIVQTVLREWNFRLSRTESGLRRRRGFFTLTDVVLPLKRVQAVILATGPIRRRFGWSALKLQSLAQDSGHGGDHVVAPLAQPGEIDAIVAAMEWRAIDRAREGWAKPTIAYFLPFAMLAVPILIGLLFLTTKSGQPIPLLFPIGFVLALLVARYFAWQFHGYRRDGDRVMIRAGALRQRQVLLPLNRIQSVDLHRGPIDKMFGVSSLIFGVAGGRGFQSHRIVAIPSDDAYVLRDHLLGDLK